MFQLAQSLYGITNGKSIGKYLVGPIFLIPKKDADLYYTSVSGSANKGSPSQQLSDSGSFYSTFHDTPERMERDYKKGTIRAGFFALKVLSAESTQGVCEFLAEIATIAETEHENLVKLHGCCIEGGHRVLVYDYLENKSIAQTLLGGNRTNIQFSWDVRAKICSFTLRKLPSLLQVNLPLFFSRK